MVLIWLVAAGLAAQAPVDIGRALDEAARLEKTGQSDAAIAAYRSLLPAAGRDESVRARILEALALAETNAGDYPSATRDAWAAAAIHAARGNDRSQARALNTGGLASLYAGQYDAAVRWLTRAIELSTTARDDEGRSEQLSNLANVFFFTGRYGEASELYAAALDITRRHAADAWAARRAHLLQVNRAALDQRLGRHDEALGVYRQLEAESPHLRPREQALILANKGVLYRNLGDPVKALAAYDRALDLFTRDQHADGQIGVLKNRGIVFALDLRDLDAARRNFAQALASAQAVDNRREAVQARLYRGEAARLAGSLEDARADFQASLEGAQALRMPEESWKALFGLGRIAVAEGADGAAVEWFERAIAVIEAIREGIRVPSLKSDFFTDKRDVYDALIAIEINRPVAAHVFDLIERSHSRAWRERLGLSGSVDLQTIQRALPPGAALFDYWNSPAGSAVVIVTRARADVTRVSVDPAAINRLISALATGPSRTWRAEAASLAASLLPEHLPSDVDHVIVVPDGAFAPIPFELLPVGSQLLVDRVAVSYMPTAAMALRRPPAAARLPAPPWRLQLAAFADPVPAQSELDESESMQGRLLSSRDEVQTIAAGITGASVLHLAADNRKAYLYPRDAHAPLLHLATHAVADGQAVERSRLLFSPANEAARDADYLFLKEAYDLHLTGVELAVLSACETERGRMQRGEGAQTFSRAFLAAGARSAVTTLWRVPDASTAAFMRAFYFFLQRDISRAEALRLTKLRFLHSQSTLSDPHYWAAFVLTGDGWRPVRWPIGWRAAVLGAVASIALVVGGWLAARQRRRRYLR